LNDCEHARDSREKSKVETLAAAHSFGKKLHSLARGTAAAAACFWHAPLSTDVVDKVVHSVSTRALSGLSGKEFRPMMNL
jgi:hypothetical protein